MVEDASPSLFPPPSPSPPLPSHEVPPCDDSKDEGERDLEQKSRVVFREKAVITKSPARKSLITPDEAFTVQFVTETPIIKQPFPITHNRLLSDDDLSSPGASDDEAPLRESFTAPGYDRLTANTFDSFGRDVKELESQRKDKEKEWERRSLSESIISRDSVNVTKLMEKTKEVMDDGSNLEIASTTQNNEPKTTEKSSLSDDKSKEEVDQESHRKSHQLGKEAKKLGHALERQSSIDDTTDKQSDRVVSTKLSERLKMFGGGASFIKPPPTPSPPEKLAEHPKKEEEEKTEEKTGAKNENKSEDHTSSDSEQHSVVIREKTTSNSSPRKRTSSRASLSTFETIEEEGVNEANEELDSMSPLPKIEPSLSRRQSEELLRLDGICPSHKEKENASEDTKDISMGKGSNGEEEHDLESHPLKKTSSLHSDPVQDQKTPGESERSKSVPHTVTQGSEAMALYMNSADLPHLNRILDEHLESKKKRVSKILNGLLSMPKWTGANVQLMFRGIKIGVKFQLQIWKQRVSLLIKKIIIHPDDGALSSWEETLHFFFYYVLCRECSLLLSNQLTR